MYAETTTCAKSFGPTIVGLRTFQHEELAIRCTPSSHYPCYQMSQYTTNENYAHSVRQQIVSIAQAMLGGQLSFLIGSRQLTALGHEADTKVDDPDFAVFRAIDSETDALPLGAVREHWDRAALAKLEPAISEAERWASSLGANACRSLIARFSP